MSDTQNEGLKLETINIETIENGSTSENEIKAFDLREGYIVDSTAESGLEGKRLKLAPDGRTVLIPQPSDSQDDPLNWSQFKKHLFLYIIAASAFLPDYGSAVGAVTLLPQAKYVCSKVIRHMDRY